MYHGPQRNHSKNLLLLKNANMVITTYGLLHRAFKSSKSSGEINESRSVESFNFFDQQWTITVYDEIHVVKNGNKKHCNQAAAVFELTENNSQFQIGLTGTPLSNRLNEIVYLARAVGINCKTQFWLSSKFRNFQQSVNSFMSRSSWIMVKDQLPPMPKKTEYIVLCSLTKQQIIQNTLLLNIASKRFNRLMENESKYWAFEMLKIWTKMRLLCHGNYMLQNDDNNDDDVGELTVQSNDEPNIQTKECHDQSKYLSEETEDEEDDDRNNVGKTCRSIPVEILPTPSILEQNAKSHALLDILQSCVQRNECAVVFMQWHRGTEFLISLVERTFKKNIKCLRYDCSMSRKDRESCLDYFQNWNNSEKNSNRLNNLNYPSSQNQSNRSKINVLFCGLKSGGVGISLTCANVVVLFDGDFVPANEWQAIARVWRANQTKEVRVYRLFTAGRTVDMAMRTILMNKAHHVVPMACPDVTGYEYNLKHQERALFKEMCHQFFDDERNLESKRETHSINSIDLTEMDGIDAIGDENCKNTFSDIEKRNQHFIAQYIKSCDSQLKIPGSFIYLECKNCEIKEQVQQKSSQQHTQKKVELSNYRNNNSNTPHYTNSPNHNSITPITHNNDRYMNHANVHNSTHSNHNTLVNNVKNNIQVSDKNLRNRCPPKQFFNLTTNSRIYNPNIRDLSLKRPPSHDIYRLHRIHRINSRRLHNIQRSRTNRTCIKPSARIQRSNSKFESLKRPLVNGESFYPQNKYIRL